MDSPLKVSKLKPGDQISGKLLQDIYSGAAEIFPSSSVVHLTVNRVERLGRMANDHWRWAIKAFTRQRKVSCHPFSERYEHYEHESVLPLPGFHQQRR